MNRKIFTFSVIVINIAIFGCSSSNNKKALGDFEYAQNSSGKILAIPTNLNTPKQYDTYQIANEAAVNGEVGALVDVRSPLLVLPVAASSRIDGNSKDAIVWFDQVIEGIDLKTFISNAIQQEVSNKNIEITKVDNTGLVWESGWFEQQSEHGTWPFTSLVTDESMRYRYTMSSKSHGRSVSLKVELIDHQYEKEEQLFTAIDQRRAEITMLNELIAQVDYQYRLKQNADRKLIANKNYVSLGENNQGEAAYIVALKRDLLWNNMPFFFEKYGFVVDDLNESEKVYLLSYKRPESSFWQRLWGDEKPMVDIPDGKYQFKLAEQGQFSSVTIYDENKRALPKATLESIYNVMAPALSFRDAF